jgi:hypothetical protein
MFVGLPTLERAMLRLRSVVRPTPFAARSARRLHRSARAATGIASALLAGIGWPTRVAAQAPLAPIGGAHALATARPSAPSPYLFVWAGPNGASAGGNDFIAVLDANPASRTYGKVLASRDVAVAGAMAHHIELTLPTGHALFASDYMTGRIFLLDLANPLRPHLVARIDSVPGFRRPHSFARLPNGNVVTSMQFGDRSVAGDPGGLAEFDPAGRLLRTSSAADAGFPGARIRPNGVELLPAIDRIVTTSMPMDDERTADVVQIWRLSDLHLLKTIAVPQVAGDSTGNFPYDTRALADGRTAMLDTYYCGLYRISRLDTSAPRIELVHTLRVPHAEGCAVAVVVGRYWVVPVAYGRVIVSLDVTDPAHPVEVSRLRTDSTFLPHWISADRASDRLVINSADDGDARVLIAHLDRRTGKLAWDARFRDAGSARPGVSFDRRQWPHGSASHAMAHSALFGPAVR